jgi:hypothetical protein
VAAAEAAEGEGAGVGLGVAGAGATNTVDDHEPVPLPPTLDAPPPPTGAASNTLSMQRSRGSTNCTNGAELDMYNLRRNPCNCWYSASKALRRRSSFG